MSIWTDERIEQLRTLVLAKNLSYAEIASAIGCGLTRNACIGKALRLGITNGVRTTHGRPYARKAAPAKPPAVKRTRSIRTGRLSGALQFIEVSECAPIRELPADQIPVAQRKQLVDLRANDCRWPYGEPGTDDFFFCGAPQGSPGQSYCAFHSLISRARKVTISDAERERRREFGRRAAVRKAHGRRVDAPGIAP